MPTDSTLTVGFSLTLHTAKQWYQHARSLLSVLFFGAPRPALPPAPMAKVVIVGGGTAGSILAKLLEDHADVTVIDSKDYFEVTWAILRGLVEPAQLKRIIFPHSDYLKKARVIVGTVTGATATEVTLADGQSVPYDYLVIATGSAAASTRTLAERVAYIEEENKKIAAAKRVLIVGGGPVGVELAGELVTDFSDKEVTLVQSGPRLLEFIGPKASAKALKWLESKKVTVVLNDRVEASPDQAGSSGTFKTQSGKEIETDYIYFAGGGKANASWLEGSPFSGAVEKSKVKVDNTLRIEGHPNVFAVGDITDVKELKQGYFAVIHSRTTAANILTLIKKRQAEGGEASTPAASAAGAKLKTYTPGPEIAMISLGRKDGLAQLPFGTFTGWFPASMKSKDMFISKARKDLGLKP